MDEVWSEQCLFLGCIPKTWTVVRGRKDVGEHARPTAAYFVWLPTAASQTLPRHNRRDIKVLGSLLV